MVTKIEVCYYAKNHYTGEIWECREFKTLYQCVCREINSYLHGKVFYDFISVELCYGVVIHSDDGSCEYKSMKEMGFVAGSVMDKKVHRAHLYN